MYSRMGTRRVARELKGTNGGQRGKSESPTATISRAKWFFCCMILLRIRICELITESMQDHKQHIKID